MDKQLHQLDLDEDNKQKTDDQQVLAFDQKIDGSSKSLSSKKSGSKEEDYSSTSDDVKDHDNKGLIVNENRVSLVPNADYSEERLSKERALIKMAEGFRYFARNDDYKTEKAYKKGGFALTDKTIVKRLRSSGTEVVKMIGQRIFSGNFNLTTISFPIKCMCAQSILQVQPAIQSMNSYYLNYAASISDPVERMKLFMTCTVAYQFICH